jgi:transcriptional regulator with XRE-family HTH domain
MKRFGVNVKRARLASQLTLKELASISGVSQAMLSDIERGAKIPTIEVACKISDALEVNLLTLLEKEDNRINIIRKNERPVLASETNVTRFLLSPSLPFSPIEFEYCVLPFGKSSGIIKRHQPPIKEYIAVTTGKMELRIGEDDKYILAEGDSASYQISSTHELINIGHGDACFYYISENKSRHKQ